MSKIPSCAVEPSGRTSVSRVVRQWAAAMRRKFLVARFAGRVEDDRHVHHDVDEQRLRPDERAQVLALLQEPHRQRAAGLDQHVVQPLVAGQLVPGPIRVQEDEAQVVDVAVVLAMLEQPAVVLGPRAPRRARRCAGRTATSCRRRNRRSNRSTARRRGASARRSV